jgi:hypothetical protein
MKGKERNNVSAKTFHHWRICFVLFCFRGGYLSVLKRLQKADPNFIRSKDSFGNTALIVAVQFGHLEILKWLILQAPDILNEQNIGGDTGTFLNTFIVLFLLLILCKVSQMLLQTN